MKFKSTFILLLLATITFAQSKWTADWIKHPTLEPNSGAMVLFRKSFDIKELPAHFLINISADNHYRLFVNGTYITRGPARGDLYHWNYETLDIARFLEKGKNVIAVEVVNWGEHRSFTFFSQMTNFILNGVTDAEKIVDTHGGSWKCMQNQAYVAKPVNWMTDRTSIDWGFYVGNPTDSINGNKYPWGWQSVNFDDSNWENAQFSDGVGLSSNLEIGGFVYSGGKVLTPRLTGLLHEFAVPFKQIRRYSGCVVSDDFIHSKGSQIIPANSKVSIVIDQQELTMGYPSMNVSKGKNATIRVTYSENPIIAERSEKGNRNDIENKYFVGIKDYFVPDGGEQRIFVPTYLRAFRYIQLDIETKQEPLILNDYHHVVCMAPISLKAKFETDNDTINAIFLNGWRTASVCAQDVLLSDAAYEQMQYVGDSRVHNLTLLTTSGDDLLTKNALIQFNNSRIPEGLTLACYPNNYHLVIPSYSLIWIDQIYDYMMWKDDKSFLSTFTIGINSVLEWFENHRTNKGLLSNMEGWCALGWPKGYVSGVPPVDKNDINCLYSLHYAYTLRHAAKIYQNIGKLNDARMLENRANTICKLINKYCKNKDGFYTESDKNKQISQITNIMAILAGATKPKEAVELMKQILGKNNWFGEVDLFLNLYLFEAMDQTGYGNQMLDRLGEWKLMLKRGMTTFSEVPLSWGEKDQRSECHPWSTVPNYFFFRITCGIKTLTPGFSNLVIEPNPGQLSRIEAIYPHPKGELKMNLKFSNKQVEGSITLPDNIQVTFKWQKKSIPLHLGINKIQL